VTTAEPLTAEHRWDHEPAVRAADDHSVLDRWARVVSEHHDEPALSGDGRALTFGETDRLSSGLAAVLLSELDVDDHGAAGVGAEPGGASRPVGIMAGQRTEAAVAVLALAKAGRTVVLLDEHMPTGRLEHVVALAGISEVLAAPAHAEVADTLTSGVGGRTHDLVAMLDRAETASVPVEEAADRPGGTDPLVIVFTSGSTGLPKGVAITHRQELENAEHDAVALGLGPGDRLCVVLPISFAAGFSYTFNALLCAAEVVLLDARDLGVDRFLDRLDATGADALACTPHLVRSIVRGRPDHPERPVLGALRFVVTVGEPVTYTDVAAARPHLGAGTTFWNGFGSSEMGAVAYCPVAPQDPLAGGVVPAGWPLPGKSVQVVRADGSSAAPGETGELVVVSRGMTAGYWGAPELTARHLTPGALGEPPAWRQGDLARIDADGRLVLVGRSDDAVKVRGYLVEPSEVEATLRALPEVDDAVVTAAVAPPAATRLVAYVVGRAGQRTPAPAALRRALRDRLPEYMVPAAIVPMTELPRTERGKVDRTQLPAAPSVEAEMTEDEYDQWELVVGQIWAEVLGLGGVRLDEDFSALGGDSLSAEEMLALVQQRLGVDLVAADLLEHPTLRTFARRVRAGTAALPSHPDVVKVSGARTPGARTSGANTSGASMPGGHPLFCFAGAGALALTFLPLSKYFPEHDVYAFQQHALERRGVPDWSVGRSARRYLALMRIVQPRGPYLLVGHSLGGLVALEVARLLTAAGEQVEHVALLDTYLPRSKAEQARLHFGRIEQREPVNPTVRAVRRTVDRIAERVMPAGVPYGRQAAKRFRAYTAGVLRFGGQKDFDAFFDQAAIATRRHRPTPFTGRTTYVVADANPDADGWGRFLSGDRRTVRIAAEHTSLMREPHVADLAAALRAAFAKDGATAD